MTDVCGGCRDAAIYLDYLERRYQITDPVTRFKRLSCKHFCPGDTVDPMPVIARQFRRRLRTILQPIDQDVGVKERVGHGSDIFVGATILADALLVFHPVANVGMIFPVPGPAQDPVLVSR